MFTGIIEEIGTIGAVERHEDDAARLTIDAPGIAGGVKPGDSVAVSGVCLTAVNPTETGFEADVMKATLDASSLGRLQEGDRVNLERALPLGGRLGGHLVQGHVDATGEVLSRTPATHWEVVRLSLPATIAPYVVEKGSIAVEGTSLTVSALGDDFFEVSLIPTTLAETTLDGLRPGDPVNLEADVVGKYLKRLAETRPGAGDGR
ncbi:riboflavin synthase [Corynebacterium otitidis]|uniref:riboflavin synthase n=1 Tax=Corynebacterium otitidis TaxID=29321 RepID=UPI000627C1CF|nr:riboflavin synthase [Corynebacterium otitidis]KKO84533.1 riboflavin synthase subunit alpha [Corynebacterium otitidis]